MLVIKSVSASAAVRSIVKSTISRGAALLFSLIRLNREKSCFRLSSFALSPSSLSEFKRAISYYRLSSLTAMSLDRSFVL